MRRALALIALLAFAFVAYASESPIGALVSPSGASVNNLANGAWPDAGVSDFLLPSSNSIIVISVQCSLPACVLASSAGDSGTVTCTPGATNSGVVLPAGSPLFDIPIAKGTNALSMVPVAVNPDGGLVTCQVFQPSL